MTLLLLLLALAPRTYHTVALENVAATRHTHVCTIGPVVYVRKQQDGDVHITLDNGRATVVVDIIPLIPLTPPAKGQRVKVCGITRTDKHHAWGEIHPAERIQVLR
jgi:hypothetical protein